MNASPVQLTNRLGMRSWNPVPVTFNTSSTTAPIDANPSKNMVMSGSDIRNSANVDAVSANAKIVVASQSTCTGFDFPLGSSSNTAAAITASGMLNQNAYSQPIHSLIVPPHSGPMTPPASALAPTMPYATARRPNPTMSPADARAIGITAPAPIDWTTRAAIMKRYGSSSKTGMSSNQSGMFGLIATSAEPIVKIDSATKNARRYPQRSEIRPMTGIVAEYPIRKAIISQAARSMSVAGTFRLVRTSGNTVATTVWSSAAMNTP